MLPIYSETESYRMGVDDTEYQTKLSTDVKQSVWQHPHKVSISSSVLLTGHPNHKTLNKRWWRWYTTASMGFYRNKYDNIVIYNCRRQPNGRRYNQFIHNNMNKPMGFLQDGEGKLAETFRQAMWETFGITSQEQFYPMMSEYDLRDHTLIPTNIRSAFKLDNWEAYTSHIFGKTRTPRLVASVGNTEPYVVALAHQFRGLVSDDVLVKFVENTQFDDELSEQFKPHAPLIRKTVKGMNPAVRERILSRGIDFLDTQRIKVISNRENNSSVSLDDPKPSSWSELIRTAYGDIFDDVNYLSSF